MLGIPNSYVFANAVAKYCETKSFPVTHVGSHSMLALGLFISQSPCSATLRLTRLCANIIIKSRTQHPTDPPIIFS